MTHAAYIGVLVLTVSACGRTSGEDVELLVAAASGLALALPELTAAFEQESGIRTRTTIGSTGHFAQQILNGAPIDVFLAADAPSVDRLVEGGRAHGDERAVYARGRLALVTAAHVPRIARLEDLVADGVGRIAIANPQHAPYGRAARQALQNAGVWSAVEPRLVIAENVRQTMQFVGSGNVDAAITALALIGADGDPSALAVPDSLHEPLLQEVLAIAGRPNHAAALRFVRFMTGDVAQGILARHHFLPPGPAP